MAAAAVALRAVICPQGGKQALQLLWQRFPLPAAMVSCDCETRMKGLKGHPVLSLKQSSLNWQCCNNSKNWPSAFAAPSHWLLPFWIPTQVKTNVYFALLLLWVQTVCVLTEEKRWVSSILCSLFPLLFIPFINFFYTTALVSMLKDLLTLNQTNSLPGGVASHAVSSTKGFKRKWWQSREVELPDCLESHHPTVAMGELVQCNILTWVSVRTQLLSAGWVCNSDPGSCNKFGFGSVMQIHSVLQEW